MEPAIVISIVALTLSVLTAWLSFFHRGRVRMSRPGTIAFLASDGFRGHGPKVFIRTLMYTTGNRGHAIENMSVRLHSSDGREQAFTFWAYGAREHLVPSSGFRVGPEGREENHHFLLDEGGPSFQFNAGEYTLEILWSSIGSGHPKVAQQARGGLTEDEATALNSTVMQAFCSPGIRTASATQSKLDSRPSQGRSHSVSGAGSSAFSWE